MTTAKSITCQSCGANLAYNGYQRTVRCEYCETVNTIETPDAKVSVVIVPPRTPGDSGGGLGIGSHVTQLRVLVSAGIALLTMGVTFAWCLQSGTHHRFGFQRWQKRTGHSSRPGTYVDCTAPIARDVDRDGVEDLLGFVRVVTTSGQSRHVVALGGAGFGELWRSEAIGGSSSDPVALYDARTAVVVAQEATLTAYDPGDGKKRWISRISDRVEELALGDGVLRITSADRKRVVIGLKDGKPADAAPDDQDLQVLPASFAGSFRRYGTGRTGPGGTGGLLGLEVSQWSEVAVQAAYCPPGELQVVEPAVPGSSRPRRFELSGNRIQRSRSPVRPSRRTRGPAIVCGGELGVAYATTRTGSGYGMIIGFEPEGKDELWRSRLAPAGSVARVSQAPQVVFGPRQLLVAFDLVGAGPRARLLSRQGAMAWDVALPRDGGGQVIGAALGPLRAYVRLPGKLLVLDLKKGAILKTLPGT